MRQFARAGLFGLCLALAPAAAMAAGSGGSSSDREPGELDRAERMIEEGRYEPAVAVLEDVVAEDPDNADAYNWLGYAHRNLGEYDRAVDYYERALDIDPEHLGALEYLGETYLAMDDLGGAEAMLARLDSACWFGCEEYDELEEAIAQYRAEREGN
jgi:tetratricopeptide (TPR) repeat protein